MDSKRLEGDGPLRSVKAECALIGHMASGNTELISIIVGTVKPIDFFDRANRRIWGAVCRLYESGVSIDYLAIEDEMKATIDKQEGVSEWLLLPDGDYLDSCDVMSHSSLDPVELASKIAERAEVRRMIHHTKKITASLERGKAAVEAASDLVRASKIPSIGDTPITVKDAFKEIEDAASSDGPSLFLECGLEAIDRSDVLELGTLMILAGRSSVGKTAMSLKITDGIADQGGPSVYYSMEMKGTAIHHRNMARGARLPVKKIKKARLNDGEWARLGSEAARLSRQPLLVYEGRKRLEHVCASILTHAKQHGTKLVVIDHLEKMILPKMERHDLTLGNATEMLAATAGESGCLVILLVQLNRESEKAEDKKPKVYHLKNSGDIEQDADSILLLWRPEKWWPGFGVPPEFVDEIEGQEHPRGPFIDVIIGKQRDGETGIARLYEDIKHGQFWDIGSAKPGVY